MLQKISWVLNIVLVIVIGAMVYMFLIRGSVAPSKDGRTAIIISDGERNMMLGDMRRFLEHVQIISVALGDNDMDAVVEAAENVGTRDENPPPALIAKLPLEFKTMGMGTHTAFDQLAKQTRDGANVQEVAAALGEIMTNCVTCHATYKIEIEAE